MKLHFFNLYIKSTRTHVRVQNIKCPSVHLISVPGKLTIEADKCKVQNAKAVPFQKENLVTLLLHTRDA
jgi:hypothetical protein